MAPRTRRRRGRRRRRRAIFLLPGVGGGVGGGVVAVAAVKTKPTAVEVAAHGAFVAEAITHPRFIKTVARHAVAVQAVDGRTH